MITGDQALPQPDDLPGDTILPAIPEAVLRREALIRSFRWACMGEGGWLIWQIGVRAYWHWQAGPPYGREIGVTLVEYVAPGFIVFVAALLFWGLSWPGRFTRATVLLAVTACALVTAAFAYEAWGLIHSTLSMVYGGGFRSWLYIGVTVPQVLQSLVCVLYLTWLAYAGAGKALYRGKEQAPFGFPDSVRKREIYWIGVIYLLLMVARIFAIHWLYWYLSNNP